MEDLIRRSDAIAILEDLQSKHLQFCLVPFRIAIEKMQAIPSADRPQDDDWEKYSDRLWKNAYERGKADRPQGKWIRREYWSEGVGMGESYGFYYECSNCGEQQKGGYDNCGINYCPDCGAKMRGNRNE